MRDTAVVTLVVVVTGGRVLQLNPVGGAAHSTVGEGVVALAGAAGESGQEDEGGGEDGPEGLGPRQAGQLGEGGVDLQPGDGQQQQLCAARDWQPPDQGQYSCLE